MSNFTDFIGGGGSASFPTIFLSKSQTWVPPQDGNIMIHVIGAGGSGATNYTQNATSGAAGGYCKKNTLAVTTSGSFTIVVGAGGSRVSGDTSGNAGGNSTVAGTGLSSTLTANGGAGGVTNSYADVAGGSASGGDVNNTGGKAYYVDNGYSGGGAVGLAGTGNSGFSSGRDYRGGDCDIVGDLWSSTLGQIAGGRGGTGFYTNRDGNHAKVPTLRNSDGGPFAGGGSIMADFSYQVSPVVGGNGGIGAGGGMARYASTSSFATSGRGGEGIVIIQYIP